MEQKEITVKCKCTSCKGSGLHVDSFCHDGAATVCRDCKGNGYTEFTYTPFVSRKKAEGITRVFSYSPFRHLYPAEHAFDDVIVDFSQYGCTYEEWENGVTPSPLPD